VAISLYMGGLMSDDTETKRYHSFRDYVFILVINEK